MRAVIYDRVSEYSDRSISEQEAENRTVVERHGWELVGVFTDNDRSASRYAKKKRPEWNRLVAELRLGKADVLVTWEASRSTRDLEVYVQLREVCRELNVLWCYNGRTYDFRRSDDSFQTGLDILLAEKEVDQSRERILRAMRANAVQGRPHGRVPFGYAREYDPSSGALVRQVINQAEAKVVREAAKRVLGGETPNAIAADFNRRGIPTPQTGTWDLSRVRRMITNPAYVSQRVHQGKVIGKAEWPAILDEGTFQQCVAKMSDPSRKTTNEHAVKYLLSGIAMCAKCDRTVKVMPQRGGYKTYICRQFHVSRKVVWVDQLIEKLIIARMSQPDALSLFETTNDNDTVLAALGEKRARLDNFYEAAATGEISPQALGKVETRLLSEIEALEQRIRRSDVPSVVYELAKKPAVVWKRLTLEQKRAVISCLLEIRILPAHPGRRLFEPEAVQAKWRRLPATELAATA